MILEGWLANHKSPQPSVPFPASTHTCHLILWDVYWLHIWVQVTSYDTDRHNQYQVDLQLSY